jgi:Flp pilus assembly protein TadD
VSPTYVWLAQRKLDAASNAFDARNCGAATSSALSSISIVGVNAQPYEILGYCDVYRNMPDAALTAINKAVSLDPHNSDYALDLAVIRAAAGLNPLSAARKAVSLNPKDPVVQAVWLKLRSGPPSRWQRDGRQFISQFTSL